MYFKILFELRKTTSSDWNKMAEKKNPEKLKKRQFWQMKASKVKTKKDRDGLHKTHLKVRLTLNFSKRLRISHDGELAFSEVRTFWVEHDLFSTNHLVTYE